MFEDSSGKFDISSDIGVGKRRSIPKTRAIPTRYFIQLSMPFCTVVVNGIMQRMVPRLESGSNKSSILSALIIVVVVILTVVLPNPAPSTGCTTEGLVCPDGSTVGREGPQCTFAPCPLVNEIEGTIRGISLSSRVLTIETETGFEYSLTLTDETRIFNDSREISLRDLELRDAVYAEGKGTKEDSMVANTIYVLDPSE